MNEYHYSSLRACEARTGKIFEPKLIRVLMIAAIVALAGLGIYLMFFLQNACAWLAWSLAIALLVLYLYAKYELIKAPLRHGDKLEDILSRDVLTLLGKNPKPSDIAEIAPRTNSGNFLATRYSITPNFLSIVTEKLPSSWCSGVPVITPVE